MEDRMSGRSIVEPSGALPFDSTQTVRAVTLRELQDSNPQKWFAVQLVVSDRPFNLETMPRLDVFTAYRLYAIQGRLGTNACHALRLGFFADRQSALSLCADIQALFRFASVVQVSAAEQARFEKAPKQEVPPEKPPQTGAKVVEISSARRAVAASSSESVLLAAPSAIQPKISPPIKKPASTVRGPRKFKSLSQELMEEARQIELARSDRLSGKQASSWLSRLLGRSS
jgi:hypothetical protein